MGYPAKVRQAVAKPTQRRVAAGKPDQRRQEVGKLAVERQATDKLTDIKVRDYLVRDCQTQGNQEACRHEGL